MKRPTRAEHLEQCRIMSVALTEYVKDTYEATKFFVDLWEPQPMPDDWRVE